jgi:hypothetical protein
MPISQVPFAGISNPVNFRNRIINGDMGIDQRNAGASVTAGTAKAYTLDRWFNINSVTSKYTIQQNAASVTPPAGFVNYLGITSSAATTVNAGDYYGITQNIEGLNVADLAWGTANAKTITLSFWVRSSLTGTFGGSLRNSAENRSYPFTYSISSANTWEFKTITIAGDTSGTWLKTNGVGINLTFSLGTGSTFSGTANAWAGTNYASATSAVNVVSTNGATLYITGVQLEAGEQASGFEFMPIDTNLARCQRYFFNSVVDIPIIGIGTQGGMFIFNYTCTMRANPTLTMFRGTTANQVYRYDDAATEVKSWTILGTANNPNNFYDFSSSFFTVGKGYGTSITASAEL